jgi:transposase-like protein
MARAQERRVRAPPHPLYGSLLRSWLRPHRGISQEKLPLYLGFFQFVHNTRRWGRALLGSLTVR